MSTKPTRDQRRNHFLRRLRVYFRRFRITVLMALFVLVCIGVYLNQVGLPGFVKRPLLASLKSRGVNLEFSRLRLRGHRGIVADDVRLAGVNSPVMPEFSARSADLRLNYAALARFEFDIEGVTLREGSLIWQLAPTNEPPQEMAITNLMADLRFLPGDAWSLDRFEADFMGATFHASGQVTNASVLPVLLRNRSKLPPELVLERLRSVQQHLSRIEFLEHPEFRLSFDGDASDPSSFNGVFTVEAPDAITPWGGLLGARFSARLTPAALLEGLSGHASLKASRVITKWAEGESVNVEFEGQQSSPADVECRIAVSAANVRGDWTHADGVTLAATWTHGTNEWRPQIADITARAWAVSNRWFNADEIVCQVKQHTPDEPLAMNDPSLSFWNYLSPYALDVKCEVTNASARGITASALAVALNWDAPRLVVKDLGGELAGGSAAIQAELDVLSRKLNFEGRAALDFHQFEPALTEKSREWLNNYTWEQSPDLMMNGQLILPEWTNRTPDWRGEVQPDIVLNGRLALTNGSYRGITALSAVTHLDYSNRVWHLPDLLVTRPEGKLQVDLTSDEVSHDYSAKLRGHFDPRALASQLGEKGQRALGYFEFTNAPWLDAEVRGRWYERERTWAKANIAWTNFSYRAQHADRVTASVEYSNLVLQVYKPRVERGKNLATADGLLFDFASNKAYLTNGYSDTDPMAIARIIGPKTAEAVEPYQFIEPPVARVNGVIPLKGERDADLHFDLSGGPFHWSRFRVPTISGQVHWANESVTLTNIVTSFYGGEARGNAWFDVRERGSTPFQFTVQVTNANLNAMMSDLHSPTNKLEGILTGELAVTNANTADLNSWNGYGRATLRDGLLWDSPVFGVMSKVMNSVVPGIGNSRASEAGGTFSISNSIIRTSDLDIRASGMRLLYDGTVDFQTRVKARVEAELLRDTWFVGKLVSTALWPVSKLFEYKVSGTLADPKPEPIYLVPRLFLAPLTPVQSFKGMFQEPEGDFGLVPDPLLKQPGTNASPTKVTEPEQQKTPPRE